MSIKLADEVWAVAKRLGPSEEATRLKEIAGQVRQLPTQPNHHPDQEVRERLLSPEALGAAWDAFHAQGGNNLKAPIEAAYDAAYPNQSSEERDVLSEGRETR